MTLALDDNLDLVIPTREVTGIEEAAQKVRVRLNTWRGEWLFDVDEGIDYLDYFQQKQIDTEQIRRDVREEILAVDGVRRIETLDVSQDGETIVVEGRVVFGEDADEGVGALEFDLAPETGNTHPYLTILAEE